MGERSLHTREVAGSKPAAPITGKPCRCGGLSSPGDRFAQAPAAGFGHQCPISGTKLERPPQPPRPFASGRCAREPGPALQRPIAPHTAVERSACSRVHAAQTPPEGGGAASHQASPTSALRRLSETPSETGQSSRFRCATDPNGEDRHDQVNPIRRASMVRAYGRRRVYAATGGQLAGGRRATQAVRVATSF